LTGCQRQPTTLAATPPKPKAPPRVAEILLKSYRANEAGAIMILMYHHFSPRRPSRGYNRKPDDFRKDLEALYKRGYYPVTVSEIVENRMDVPAGKTPVALTFDDSLPTQFRYIDREGARIVDPDCAVGILAEFCRTHPDWPFKATFFILPPSRNIPPPFYQPESVAEKLAYLLEKGCEIGNHTVTHRNLARLSPDQVRQEIGAPLRYLAGVAPQARMQVLALPYGIPPREEARKWMLSGELDGIHYRHKAILKAASRPVLSPIAKPTSQTRDFAPFDPHGLERILPDPTQRAATFERWLAYFDANPRLRYISDGHPDVVAVPKTFRKSAVESRLRPGQVLQIYPLETPRNAPTRFR